MILNPVRLR